MKDDFYISKACEVLQEIQYITIASTTPDGLPWNTPVFSAFDTNLHFYWSSSPDAQHSINISHCSDVFIVIYKSVVAQGTGWGVYIKANASAVNEPSEIEKALGLLGKRRGRPFTNLSSFSKSGPQQVYCIEPREMWINDAKKDSHGEYVEDYRVQIDIRAVKKYLRSL
jgi:hypothetical protein